MMIQLITRPEAEKLYKEKNHVLIGVYSKKDGGAWWKINSFAPDTQCKPFEKGTFDKIAKYFASHYCYRCRTRYAIEVPD